MVRRYDPEQVTKEIGLRIAELRKDRGWTQEQFSVELRSTFQWVSQVEAGANLTVHSLVKVANALGVTLTDLLMRPSGAVIRRRGRPKKRPATSE